MNSEHNILIGVLALKHEFISQGQFTKAMRVWTSNTSRSMDSVLFRLGFIDHEARKKLEQMVLKPDQEKSISTSSQKGSRSMLDRVKGLDIPRRHSATVDATMPSVTWVSRDNSQTARSTELPEPKTESTKLDRSGDRFHIVRRFARGGLGEVSVARDSELNREVALKEILDDFADDRDARARFLREAEITGGLEHPGIVPVYGLGQYDDGRPYYAMRFVEGQTLKEAVDEYWHSDQSANPSRSLRLRELVTRFVAVCHTIAYAHSRGVCHRDLKPSNIILGNYGESLVVDWGLAKYVDSTSDNNEQDSGSRATSRQVRQTRSGQVLGSPSFMSPEQASGEVHLHGPLTDIHGLGATLYYILTGRAPAAGKDRRAAVNNAISGTPKAPRTIRKGIPRALEAICMKAMSRDPKDRHEDARILIEELERWLAHEHVGGYTELPWEWASRTLRRGRVVAVTAVAFLAGTLLSSLALAASLCHLYSVG